MSHGTIGAVVRGTHGGSFNDKTLAGLALAIDVPESEIRRAAGVPTAAEFALPASASRLSARGRSAMRTMLKALLEAEDAAAHIAAQCEGTERSDGTTETD